MTAAVTLPGGAPAVAYVPGDRYLDLLDAYRALAAAHAALLQRHADALARLAGEDGEKAEVER